MEEILLIVQNFFKELNPLYYLAILAILFVIAIFTKNYKALKQISEEGIKMSAKYFNSNEGQKKMDNAVLYLQNKTKDLPWLARIIIEKFGTKAMLVNIIEWFYKFAKKKLQLEIQDEDMDVIGNEVKKN